MYAEVFKCCRQVYFGEETSTKRRLGASEGVWEASWERLGASGERLGASGERLEGVLERPGRVLGRLEAFLVAFKVVLDGKMSSESAQDRKT